MKRRGIRFTMMVSILTAVLAVFAIILFVVGRESLRQSTKMSDNVAASKALEASQSIKLVMEKAIWTGRNLVVSFEMLRSENEKNRILYNNLLLRNVLDNPDHLSTWAIFEPNMLDGNDAMYKGQPGYSLEGRFTTGYYKKNGFVELELSEETSESFYSDEYYLAAKLAKQEVLLEPYYYSYDSSGVEKNFVTTIAFPVFYRDSVIGVVGIDFSLAELNKQVSRVRMYDSGFCMLVSNGGVVVTHPNGEYIGKPMQASYEFAGAKELVEKIAKGEKSKVTVTIDGVRMLIYAVPIWIGKTGKPWSVCLFIPENEAMAEPMRMRTILLWLSVVGLLSISLIVFVISTNITKPIKRITAILLDFSHGKMDVNVKDIENRGGELGAMATALSHSIEGVKEKVAFAEQIGAANLDVDMHLLSDHDKLGQSLLTMRNSLREAKVAEEERKRNEQQRSWANEGISIMSDILRQSNSIQELCDRTLSTLVKYVGANQGGVFLTVEENSMISYELTSAYAYNKKKFLSKRFAYGVGLVGGCAVEGEPIYITDLPEGYSAISSGLGESNPRALFLVPLKVEDEVLGVLELASLLEFEEYQKNFIERVAESMASTLRSVKINVRTKQLLETSQQQTEIMSAQEEEMRQNMEELQASQEESQRRSAEFDAFSASLNSAAGIVEFDLEGIAINVNQSFLNMTKRHSDEILRVHFTSEMFGERMNSQEAKEFWFDVRTVGVKRRTTFINVAGKEVMLQESFAPVYNMFGVVNKIVMVVLEVTQNSKKR